LLNERKRWRGPALNGILPMHNTHGDPYNEKVNWVAQAWAGDLAELRVRAAAAADEIGPAAIEHLSTLFHSEHSPPTELAERFPGLGNWMAVRQLAIFEIFYHAGRDALPVLKRVAFGAYDWTQGNAIEILCRLAADGIEEQEIVDALLAHLSDMREEAHMYALRPLLHYAKTNAKLAAIVSKLLVVPEFQESFDAMCEGPRR